MFVGLCERNGLLTGQSTANSRITHTLENHKTRTEQEKWFRNMCKPCSEGFFQPFAGLTCDKQQPVSNRQQVIGGQGELQLGFTELSLSISEHLRVTSYCHRSFLREATRCTKGPVTEQQVSHASRDQSRCKQEMYVCMYRMRPSNGAQTKAQDHTASVWDPGPSPVTGAG